MKQLDFLDIIQKFRKNLYFFKLLKLLFLLENLSFTGTNFHQLLPFFSLRNHCNNNSH